MEESEKNSNNNNNNTNSNNNNKKEESPMPGMKSDFQKTIRERLGLPSPVIHEQDFENEEDEVKNLNNYTACDKCYNCNAFSGVDICLNCGCGLINHVDCNDDFDDDDYISAYGGGENW